MNEEEIDLFEKRLNELPNIELDNPISAYGTINVDDLMSAIKRLKEIPDYNVLLKENKDLQNRFNSLMEAHKNSEEEIERLNKKIEQYENPEDMTLMFMWCDEKAKDEIKRLNNIINEGINKCEELADEIEIVEGAYSSWFLEIEEILKGANKK